MIASIAPKEKVGLGHMLEVEQQMPGPLEQIYAAWTSATEMARWWWPHIADARYRIDPRPGGSYRMESEAAGIAVEGEYVSLDPPREIVMTWRWLSDGVGDVEETVRIEFRPNDEGTAVTVIHELDEVAGDGDGLRLGWADVLARLARLFG
jgi:uncharacterized protein YndB with AHSA1/START domain